MDNSNYINNRQIWGDIARGAAILFVIAGHSLPPETVLYKIIFLFHVPLFFFLSGYFFDFYKYENNFKLLLKNNFKRLLLPSVVTYCLALTKLFVLLGINTIIYSLWFLLCLFCVKILLWAFLKITDKKTNILFNIFLLMIIAQTGANTGQILKLPLSFDVALVALYIAYFGYKIKEFNLFDNKKGFVYFGLLALILGYLDYKYLGLDMNHRFYSKFPLLSVNISIIISVAVIYFCKLTEKIKYYNKFMSYLGINSLIIMIFHTVAYSTYSFLFCFSARLFASVILIEVLALIPFINIIYGAKSIRKI